MPLTLAKLVLTHEWILLPFVLFSSTLLGVRDILSFLLHNKYISVYNITVFYNYGVINSCPRKGQGGSFLISTIFMFSRARMRERREIGIMHLTLTRE